MTDAERIAELKQQLLQAKLRFETYKAMAEGEREEVEVKVEYLRKALEVAIRRGQEAILAVAEFADEHGVSSNDCRDLAAKLETLVWDEVRKE